MVHRMVKSNIQQVLDLFIVMQNIQLHGGIRDDIPLDWVSVEQIYREMPHPKMTKDKIRDFCEYQTDLKNLDKRTGNEKDTRQAKAEYRVSEQGKRIIALYHDPSFSQIKNMISWTHGFSLLDKKSDDKN